MFTNALKSILFLSPAMVCTITFGQTTENNTNKDNSKIITDTIKLDTVINVKKEKLEFIVDRESEDERHDLKKRTSYFLRNARVTYGDMSIYADYIELNWNTGDVYAEGKRDSIGQIIEPTKFIQGQQEFTQDAFKVNFKTKVGIAYNVRMTEGEGVITADKVKRVNDSIMYLNKAEYTTDSYFKDGKTPDRDYFIRTSPGKLINNGENKTLIAGPTQMFIYDIPTPLVAPFAYIPLGSKRSAGILMPKPGERSDLGFFVEGIGLYVPIGEYWDIKLTGDIYTKGSWGLRTDSNYKKNYRYNGGFSASFEKRITGIKGLTSGNNAFDKNDLFRVTWRHQQDPKSNPYTNFNANVNFSSSKFYQNSINTQFIQNNQVYTNNINSSITLNKKFKDSPFSATLSMNHSQQMNQNSSTANESSPLNNITLTAPSLNVNMSRIYPFAPKAGAKKGLIQNLGVDYTLRGANEIRTNDKDIFTKTMWEEQSRIGANQRMNLTSGVTLFNYFPFSFSSSYNEVWSDRKIQKSFNPLNQRTSDEVIKGFNAYRTFNVSANISTNIYGTFINTNKDAKIQGIRHVLSPMVGYSFNPNFQNPSWGYYKSYEGANMEEIWYNQYEQALYGVAIPQLSNSLTFSLLNNLEMKVKDEKDPKGVKKVKIFESLNFSTAYNFSATSFRLAPITMSGNTSFLDRKVNVQFSGQLNPYKIAFEPGKDAGKYIDELELPRLSNFQVGTGYTFDNSTFGGKKFDEKNYSKRGSVRDENFYYDDQNYAHYAIPWSVSANLAYSYNKGANRTGRSTGTVNLNGTIKPTPYWDISATTTYDFIENEFTMLNLNFERDLRSFKMSFNWVPMGRYKYYGFMIQIKSSILSDLKYNDRSRSIF
ncbi:LPS-assembly protein LptD [Faecalibacter bovis]|uniref:LPS-assembly protein LptD n=2 Tax=Faecalibacter bovis TaxID=2898187 RepID=A0ABX7XDX1_9FLAO|nr:LPS-assembly protein LptD [Faecalibacter bovis]